MSKSVVAPRESVLPSDAKPIEAGEYLDFFRNQYGYTQKQAEEVVKEYRVLCSESSRSILFPYYWRPYWSPAEVVSAVTARALPPYTDDGWFETKWRKVRPRYLITPQNARPLYVPKWDWRERIIVCEGQGDAIKLSYSLDGVQAVASFGIHTSPEILDTMSHVFEKDEEIWVMYDSGEERAAWHTKEKLEQEQRFKNVGVLRFPHKDPGSISVEELQEWYATKF